jgi:phosphatidate cytidylyltransferase
MAQAAPTRSASGARPAGGQSGVRIASGLFLAAIALGIAYMGGWGFIAFWGGAAVLVLWEWTRLVTGQHAGTILTTGGASLVLAVAAAGIGGNSSEGFHSLSLLVAFAALGIGSAGTAVFARHNRPVWAAGGVLYSGSLALAPVVLRSDREWGFVAVIFLFTVVWTTDIVAYFAGRAIGGAKLAPGISPNKTWSGAVAGTAAAVIASGLLALAANITGVGAVAALAAALSVVGQLGDLFESALKRRFGAKDSSHLIPGHGGLLDRLDAFVAAAALAALIGVSRGGLEAPGRGLLLW